IHTATRATSELYYIVSGAGKTETGEDTIHWQKGDFLTLPAGLGSRHTAAEDAAIYYITDSPRLNYLGVKPSESRFQPTL
ncbi:cupin domain-containing protein, partial [Bacillus licheniformis]